MKFRTQFEKAKTELNVKASVRRPSIKMSVKPPTDTRRNPIAMDPKVKPCAWLFETVVCDRFHRRVQKRIFQRFERLPRTL